MSTTVLERPQEEIKEEAKTQIIIKTGNEILDTELPLMTENELEKLANYAKYLKWLRIDEHDENEEDDDDGSWADAPLTEEEEEALRQGREDFKNGIYLTLEELLEGI